MDFNEDEEYKDIEFDELPNEEGETEQQGPPSIDRSETIIYYKKRIQSLSNRINRIRAKIQHSRKIQLQFAMLLNKTVESRYGPIIVEPPIQKQTVPPLPPIHKESRTEIIKLIHNSTPTEVSKYIEKSNVISLLLFSDTSVFDARLKDSLMRASPDIQVSFFNSTFKQIKKCGEFIDRMLPLLSDFATDSSLRSQIIDSSSDYANFFEYYLNSLSTIAKLIGFPKCKAIYSTQDGHSLIFPTENFSHIINSNDSVVGILLNKKIMQISSPQKHQAYEIVSEGQVFEDYQYVLSSTFDLSSSNSIAGMLIVLSNKKFTDVDETHTSVVVEYLAPILKLFRSIFLQIAPFHFSVLSKSISSLRATDSIIPSFPEHICKICSASHCRIFLSKSNPSFPEITVLPEEDSLIRQSVKLNTSFSYKHARMRPDFNKSIDDYPILPKIASMLVAPIKGSDFIIVMYNSTIASEFTPIQKSLADSFSLSLPPLLHQLAIKRQMESITAKHKLETQSFEKTLTLVVPAIKSALNGELFKFIESVLPKSIKCFLYMKQSEGEAIRFPGGDLVDISDNLAKPDFFFETDQFDLDIDAGGDQNVKKVLVVSSPTCACILTTKEKDFSKEETVYLHRISNAFLLLVPILYFGDNLHQCKAKHQYLRDSLRLSLSSLSKLIGADVECKFFSPPLQSDPEIEAPLVVSVETKNGIEAALVSQDNSEETKIAMIAYAEWLTTALMKQKKSDKQAPFVELFTASGVLEIFKCSREKFEKWVSEVLPLVPLIRIENLKFAKELLNDQPWSSWFQQTQKLMILLCAFLQGIEENWECKSDKKTIERLKNCRPEVCPHLAAVFGTKFGIADALSDEECVSLVKDMQRYVIGRTAKDQSMVLSRVRSISMHAFKITDDSTKWLGQAMVFFARIYRFTVSPTTIADRLLQELGENGRKTEIFIAERIFLPMISFLSQRHDKLLKMNATVRETILEAKKVVR